MRSLALQAHLDKGHATGKIQSIITPLRCSYCCKIVRDTLGVVGINLFPKVFSETEIWGLKSSTTFATLAADQSDRKTLSP